MYYIYLSRRRHEGYDKETACVCVCVCVRACMCVYGVFQLSGACVHGACVYMVYSSCLHARQLQYDDN